MLVMPVAKVPFGKRLHRYGFKPPEMFLNVDHLIRTGTSRVFHMVFVRLT